MTLYAVTDAAWTGEKTLTEQTEEAMKGGITFLQLREKHLPEAAFLKEAIWPACFTGCRLWGICI